jgi:hypothetical protein
MPNPTESSGRSQTNNVQPTHGYKDGLGHPSADLPYPQSQETSQVTSQDLPHSQLSAEATTPDTPSVLVPLDNHGTERDTTLSAIQPSASAEVAAVADASLASEVSVDSDAFIQHYKTFVGAGAGDAFGGWQDMDPALGEPKWRKRLGHVGIVGANGIAVTLMASSLMSAPANEQTAQKPAAPQPTSQPAPSAQDQTTAIPPVAISPITPALPEFSPPSSPAPDNSMPPISLPPEAGMAIRAPLPSQIITRFTPVPALRSSSSLASLAMVSPTVNSSSSTSVDTPPAPPSPSLETSNSPNTTPSTGLQPPTEAPARPLEALPMPSPAQMGYELPESSLVQPSAITPRGVSPIPSPATATSPVITTYAGTQDTLGGAAQGLPSQSPDRPSNQPLVSSQSRREGSVGPETSQTKVQATDFPGLGVELPSAEENSGAKFDATQLGATKFDAPKLEYRSEIPQAALPPVSQSLNQAIHSAQSIQDFLQLSQRLKSELKNSSQISEQAIVLPLTMQAAVQALTSSQVEHLQVIHLSEADYQNAWAGLSHVQKKAIPAPEFGFVDYQRQAIVIPSA